jgi:hypothetical protein
MSAKELRSKLGGVTIMSLRLYEGGMVGRIGGRGIGSLSITSEGAEAVGAGASKISN